jgi:hypothetical protein
VFHWAMFGVLLTIAVLVSLIVFLFDRQSGPIRIFLTMLAALGGAWAANYFGQWWSAAGVLIVPAVIGALAAGLLFRSVTHRMGRKRRVQ